MYLTSFIQGIVQSLFTYMCIINNGSISRWEFLWFLLDTNIINSKISRYSWYTIILSSENISIKGKIKFYYASGTHLKKPDFLNHLKTDENLLNSKHLFRTLVVTRRIDIPANSFYTKSHIHSQHWVERRSWLSVYGNYQHMIFKGSFLTYIHFCHTWRGEYSF